MTIGESTPTPEPGLSTAGNVADVVRAAGRRYGDRPALITAAGAHTWAEFDAAVDAGVAAVQAAVGAAVQAAVGAALRDAGREAPAGSEVETVAGRAVGRRVAIALPTGIHQAAALFAVLRAGLVAVQVEPGHSDLAWVGRRVGAPLAVTDRDDHGCACRIGTDDIAGWWGPAAEQSAHAAAGEDLAFFARSGRSGPPVMLSHRAILAALAASTAAPGLDLTAQDRLVQALPLYHLVGLVSTFLPAALVGAAVVIPDRVAGRTPAEAALHAIHQHGATVLPAEPTLYRQLSRADGFAEAVAGVRLMLCGSYAVDPAYVTAIRSATGLTVRQGYGISESAATVSSTLMTTRPGEEPRAGSVGLAYPGIGLRILSDADEVADGTRVADGGGGRAADRAVEDPGISDRDDAPGRDGVRGDDGTPGAADGPARDAADGPARDAAAEGDLRAGVDDGDTLAELSDDGGIGRIAISGPTLFSGYWPDGAGGPDPDGWFVTGDIGYLDDDGELHLVDRMTETVVVSGFTVYPSEVESVLCRHPAIADAAVVAGPAAAGPSVVAVIVLRDGAAPSAADLDGYLVDKLAPFKRPSAFQVVGVLPRTEVGRLDRDALRAGFATGRGLLVPAAGTADRPTGDGSVTEPKEAGRTPDKATGKTTDKAAGKTTDKATGKTTDKTAGTRAAPDLADTAVRREETAGGTGGGGGPTALGRSEESSLPAPDVSPEPAAALSELGTRLPAPGTRAGRSAEDTDDDLF